MLAHLKRYKLRAKLSISDETARYRAYQVWGPTASLLWGNYVPTVSGAAGKHMPIGSVLPKERFCDMGCKDPRHPDLGLRVVVEGDGLMPLPSSFTETSLDEYTVRRILYGIPEGADDFYSGVSLPLESNLDLLSGVDFRKGCYLGQELTIRTYHTGVTRKRIVPIQFYQDNDNPPTSIHVEKNFSNPLPPPNTDITVNGGPEPVRPARRRAAGGVGRVCSGIYNVGLALMRLENVTMNIDGDKPREHGDDPASLVTGTGLKVRPFAPDWWPQAVEPLHRPLRDTASS
ncbi:aminomethyltransferase [Spizellomyces sp. 'palustris']|nr:aminomethyltransferase [Spizellomyces sp. 'palustris']